MGLGRSPGPCAVDPFTESQCLPGAGGVSAGHLNSPFLVRPPAGKPVAQRMQCDTEDRAAREIVDRDAVGGGSRSGVQFKGPNPGLAFFVAKDLVARFVQRREEDLQMIRVGIDPHDNARHDVGLILVIHCKRVMRLAVRANTQKAAAATPRRLGASY